MRSFLWLLLGSVNWTVSLAFAPTRRLANQHGLRHLQLPALQAGTTAADGSSQSSNQNFFGIASDAVTGLAFSLLHAFDADPIQDSSKNLRVLWVRALLDHRGLIQDDVAAKFLPPTTRGLVTTDAGSKLFDPIVKFTEWIQARTEFIDAAVEHFLSSPVCQNASSCQIVLLGAGYDTRALRYRHSPVKFFEVDLPDVTKGKKILYDNFQREHDPDWGWPKNGSHNLVPLDLNDCGGTNPIGFIDKLKEYGLDPDQPTLVVSEAVLFYVNEDAVRNIFDDVFALAKTTETLFCLTDSLKPFVDVPFSNEARSFFDGQDMELLEHRSRWGGAVHFCMAASRDGKLAKHVDSRVDGIVHSYTPTRSNNPELLSKPTFENVWYAVGYPWQIDGYETPVDAVLGRKPETTKPFATRLWGEPLVIYRDENKELVAMADVCPHRSVPLSMGMLKNNQLECVYHGWRFGEGGSCAGIPTSNNPNTLDQVTKANQGNIRAVVEHEGLVYVWRGHVLEADPSLLPTRRKGDMETVPIDTVLDYNVDYSYIIENNLDSPHLFFLHDGSVPPIESIGMLNKNLPKLKLTAFTDDCGMGHLGRLGTDRPKKLLRFDPPNIVRHGGVSGFEEEFHIVPIAPQRTRVLLRQHLPRGPILSTITSIPLVKPLLTLLVNNWNYHIALEDACVMQGQANRIEDWGAPRMVVGGLGDDLIKRYWSWRSEAHKNLDSDSPYHTEFSNHPSVVGIPSGTSFGDDLAVASKVRDDARLRNVPLVQDNQEIDDSTGNPIGSWGIKQSYLQQTPSANFPPINYKQYANLLVFDDFVKQLFVEKEECPPVTLTAPRDDGQDGETPLPVPDSLLDVGRNTTVAGGEAVVVAANY